MKKIIIIFCLLTLIGAGYWYFFTSNMVPRNQYRFVKVDRGDIESIVSSTGILSAVTTVQVGTQVSGIISKIFTDYNQKVKQGQIIALIDTTVLANNVKDAQSNIERTKAQLNEAERNYNRTKSLFAKKLAAESDVDQTLSAYELAKALLKSAEVNLERAKMNLNYATIRAPLDGTVIDRKCDVGQTVAASFSTPTLFLIANDLSKMQILANVDEGDIGQIKVGQSVRFTVQAYPDSRFKGTVREIRLQPTTIQNVVNYTVVVNVSNDERLLLPGMTATVDFLLEQQRDVLRVPNAALRFKPTTEMMAQMRKNFEERMKQMPDSVRQKWMQARKERQAQIGRGDAGGSGSFAFANPVPGGSNTGQNRLQNGTQLWYIDEDGNLKVSPVTTGITDGQMTEIKSGNVKEGMEVISSVTIQQSTQSFNPFQPQRPGGQGRRMGPGF